MREIIPRQKFPLTANYRIPADRIVRKRHESVHLFTDSGTNLVKYAFRPLSEVLSMKLFSIFFILSLVVLLKVVCPNEPLQHPTFPPG